MGNQIKQDNRLCMGEEWVLFKQDDWLTISEQLKHEKTTRRTNFDRVIRQFQGTDQTQIAVPKELIEKCSSLWASKGRVAHVVCQDNDLRHEHRCEQNKFSPKAIIINQFQMALDTTTRPAQMEMILDGGTRKNHRFSVTRFDTMEDMFRFGLACQKEETYASNVWVQRQVMSMSKEDAARLGPRFFVDRETTAETELLHIFESQSEYHVVRKYEMVLDYEIACRWWCVLMSHYTAARRNWRGTASERVLMRMLRLCGLQNTYAHDLMDVILIFANLYLCLDKYPREDIIFPTERSDAQTEIWMTWTMHTREYENIHLGQDRLLDIRDAENNWLPAKVVRLENCKTQPPEFPKVDENGDLEEFGTVEFRVIKLRRNMSVVLHSLQDFCRCDGACEYLDHRIALPRTQSRYHQQI